MIELVKSIFLIVDAITIAYCAIIIYKFDKYCDYMEDELGKKTNDSNLRDSGRVLSTKRKR